MELVSLREESQNICGQRHHLFLAADEGAPEEGQEEGTGGSQEDQGDLHFISE